MFANTVVFVLFFNWYSGGGVQLGPLGTAAANRPIGPAPGDYDDGEIGGMISRGNRSTRKKTRPSATLSPTNPTCCPDSSPGRYGGKPATNRLSYGTACIYKFDNITICIKWCWFLEVRYKIFPLMRAIKYWLKCSFCCSSLLLSTTSICSYYQLWFFDVHNNRLSSVTFQLFVYKNISFT
jgi:hypothetical protein